MADSYIPIDAPAVEDFKLDTEELTVGANTVQRERMQVAGAAATEIAAVSAANGLEVDVTRVQGTVTVDGSGVTQPISHAALTELAAAIDTEVQVDVVSSALPTGAATEAKQDDEIALLTTIDTDTGVIATSVGVMDDWDNGASDGASVSGDVAHDSADAGEPVKVGAVAIAHGTNPTAVAAADRTNLYANRAGIPFFIGGHPNIITLEAAYTAAQTDTAIVTVGAGTKIVVTQIQVVADEANTVSVGFRVGFAAATTPTTTGVVLTHPGMVPGAGVSRGDGGAIIGVGADGEDLRITSEAPTGGSIRVLVSYFTIES